MATTRKFSTMFWVLIAGIGALALFNTWIMQQIAKETAEPFPLVQPVYTQETSAPVGVPVINPNNDPLAPVIVHIETPEAFLKRQPQTSSETRDPEFPMDEKILTQ